MVSPVIVDIGKETGQLPPAISKAFREAGGAMPIVILADPAMTKIYGSYNHSTLKGQDYRKIFRDAKRSVSADIKEKTFNTSLGDPKKATEPKEEKKDAPATTAKTSEDKDIITLEDPEMKSWKSSKGTTIQAKLISVEDEKTFVLQTGTGKTIRITGDKLSLASLIEAKKLAGLD